MAALGVVRPMMDSVDLVAPLGAATMGGGVFREDAVTSRDAGLPRDLDVEVDIGTAARLTSVSPYWVATVRTETLKTIWEAVTGTGIGREGRV